MAEVPPSAKAPAKRPQPVGRTVLAALAAPFVGLLTVSAAFGVAANLADRPADQPVGTAIAVALAGAWLYSMFGWFMALPACWAIGAPLHLLCVKRGWTGWAPYGCTGFAAGLLAGAYLGRALDLLYFGSIGLVAASLFWWLVHRWR